MIYFIGNNKGQVKIGYSSHPFERLKMLQTASPDKLEILAIAPGGKDKEKFFHQKHRTSHINGEWFAESKELNLEIKVLQQCYKVVPESLDNNVILQSKFSAWINETDEVEAKYNPLIAELEAKIDEIEKQRDKEIDEIDKKYYKVE